MFNKYKDSICNFIQALFSGLSGLLLKIYNFIKEIIRGYWKYIGGVIFGAVVILVVTLVTQSVTEYKIYVPGGIDEPFFTTFKRELSQKIKESNLKLDEVPIVIEIGKSDDFKDDLVKKHSEEIARNPATLMVTGHFYSGQTKLALETYLSADPLIPVILITETTPNILPSPEKLPQAIRNKDYYPILRLSPTDNNQAKKAAEFALRESQEDINNQPKSANQQTQQEQIFWVLSDKDKYNPEYSEYLTEHFIDEIYESDHCKRNQEAKILLLPENFLPPSIDTLKTFDINDIYFAGDWKTALVLIRELTAIQQKSETEITLHSIILSDSSATQNLLDHGKFDLVNLENNSLSQAQPNNAKPQSRKNIKIYVVSAFDARYTPIDTEASKYYAQRTFTVIKRIVEKTNENIKNSRDILSNPWWNIKTYFNIILDTLNKNTFKIHRASDARNQIIKTIENDIIVTQIDLREKEEIKKEEFFPVQPEEQDKNAESEVIEDFFFMLNPEIESRIGEMYVVPSEQSLFLAKPIQFYVWEIIAEEKKDKDGKPEIEYKFENAKLGEPDYRCRIFK